LDTARKTGKRVGAGIETEVCETTFRGNENTNRPCRLKLWTEQAMRNFYVGILCADCAGSVVESFSECTAEPTLKSDAENAVKHIEGVERVNNQIEVLPTSPMDDQIRRAEYRAIYSQDLLSRYGVGNLQSIHIIVKNGHVTLEGFVDSQQDKDAATLYAKGVSNVFSVDNHLMVNGQSSC
jgi:osmotically-inducible protein OsmY